MDSDGELDQRLACQETQRAITGSEVSFSQILLNEAINFIVFFRVLKVGNIQKQIFCLHFIKKWPKELPSVCFIKFRSKHSTVLHC